MIGHQRAVAGLRRTPLLAAAAAAVILLAGGCSDLRVALGMDQVGPDEFAVEARAPLTIPPDFDLRPPKPGAPRPQEVSAAEKARQVIDAAGPGKPGDQASFALKPETAGSGQQTDPNREVAPGSLAGKLLGASDSAAGTTLDKRKTETLKGVY